MVEHDLAKVGVEGSNPFARSKKPICFGALLRLATGFSPVAFFCGVHLGSTNE